MRTLITAKLRSTLISRIFILCAAAAAISASTFATVGQSEDPMPGTGTGISITYFGSTSTGQDKWLVDGTVQAANLSDVTIAFGNAGSGITTPNAYGYFAVEFFAPPGSVVSMDATDSMSAAHDEVFLESFEL